MATNQTYFITGANRGIGFELTRQLAEAGNFIIAGCRNPDGAKALNDLNKTSKNIFITQLDVTNEESVKEAVFMAQATASGIDVVINNAGVLVRDETLDGFDAQAMQQTFSVNVLGPMLVAKHVRSEMYSDNPRIVNISSQLGSLDLVGSRRTGDFSYNASKAALNMLTRMLSHDLREQGVTVVSVHPGWVQTDMGGASAAITPEQSASGIIKLIDSLDISQTNKFFVYDGSEHAW